MSPNYVFCVVHLLFCFIFFPGGAGLGVTGGMGVGGGGSGSGMGALEPIQNYANNGCQRLHLTVGLGLNQSYLTRLLTLIPGLEYCDLNETTGKKLLR